MYLPALGTSTALLPETDTIGEPAFPLDIVPSIKFKKKCCKKYKRKGKRCKNCPGRISKN